MSDVTPSAWGDALYAAAILAVAPHAVGGVVLRAAPGPLRMRWLDALASLLGQKPLRRLPAAVTEGRLLGELDLPATLAANRPCAARGLLAETDGGILVAAMAERLGAATVVHLAAALDRGEVRVEREGLGLSFPAAVGIVALDEGIAPDETIPPPLGERLAIWLDLDHIAIDPGAAPFDPATVAAARLRLPAIRADEALIQALCATALAIGAPSLRVPLLGLAVARCAAAVAGRDAVAEDDLALAMRLVLAPRATRLPPPPESDEAVEPQSPPPQPEGAPASSGASTSDADQGAGGTLEDRVLAACTAAIPADLLARLAGSGAGPKASPAGRSGITQRGLARGRPIGTRAGAPRHGARLDLIATLRAAAPWQPMRRRSAPQDRAGPRVIVRPDDFRITRFKQQVETTTVFVVDASGSAAVQRLAEAKGAVELLLAECYIRRDQVALLAFRRDAAELLLPPTRSLARVKRSLAGLPGGGGTPLAAGLEAAAQLAAALKGKGRAARVVMLTDGRANVARDGTTGRAAGEADAVAAARLFRAGGVASLLIDTAPRPQAPARTLAAAMGAVYLPLPHADAGRLAGAVQTLLPS